MMQSVLSVVPLVLKVFFFVVYVSCSKKYSIYCVHCSAELEAQLEANQSAQEQLKSEVDQTAAAVEEMKTTVSKGE